ncbi:Crp/Fnr family transcriptional regulator [Arcticibacterium luteifluviistationis]|uniref:Crp/Fnr family transcriptional regulator n=1 Tax=Arcticibacterium luteifluviistationis TaxID=1784714 RepID=A0A2Z4G6P2_9BACT|nr:Crp/Fnr family transcriptional regulator [Arcticibacterium luteifluviistationis]AWV96819.1 Crp/Fnr family transcriptional regulator [Arcticibacterium luteifluviistationis]
MNKPIVDFLSQYIELTNEEINILSNQNFMQSFKKGTILLSKGKIAKECFFILQGCVSSYYLVDGEIKVTEFFTEKQPITPVSYTTKKHSEYYLECLEDCIISIGTPENSAELMRKIPRLAILGANIMEDQLANQRMKYDDFIKLSPEDRYQNLQKTSSELLNRVPQYLIASYLGIKPESLSRIRKRLLRKSST